MTIPLITIELWLSLNYHLLRSFSLTKADFAHIIAEINNCLIIVNNFNKVNSDELAFTKKMEEK